MDRDSDRPRFVTAWLTPGLWHEFLGNPLTAFSSAAGPVPFRADLGGTWAEIKAGFDVQVGSNASVFASVGYQAGFDGGSNAYTGKLGARLTW